MSATLLYTILTISSIGALSAIILFVVARKFHVHEDPRIDEIEHTLPGANCGGCGFAGCRSFAEAVVKDNSLDKKFCPVGGNPVMEKVGDIMGLVAEKQLPKVAVVRCNGSCAVRPKINKFEGVSKCSIAAMSYSGETGCSFGCLGYGDCCSVCEFGALSMNEETGLPQIDEEKCTACGACVEACPKMLIELRKKMPKFRKIYVACRNTEKGAVSRKACTASCIGCGKCQKECQHDAITIVNNLAFIDSEKCKLCRKCVAVCPTGSIIEIGFPPRKEPLAEAAPQEKPIN